MEETTPTWSEDPEVASRLWDLISAVRASPHNLLSPRGLEELPHRHIPECLSLARRLPADEQRRRLLDVGSGGGFPGLVIAIARPDLDVTLLEATTKKARFLETTAASLGLPVAVLNDRAEELTSTLAGGFDLVTARAVAPLPRLLGWTLPFLRRDGALYAVKGERWAEELEEARPALASFRAEVRSVPDHHRGAAGDDPWDPRIVIIGGPGSADRQGTG